VTTRDDTAPRAPSAGLEPAAILERAARRGLDMGLPYAGAVTPEEAYALLAAGAGSLIDVRTAAEHEFVGRVPDTTLIEWRRLGDREPNPEFLQRLRATADPERPVMFLCRSGVRSHSAAVLATQAGFKQALNILEGFEGDLDGARHRGAVGGWRFHGLPWIQS
jgi:rhodanese-related sulfurtransferase